jgi:DNA polymerase III delta subunit
VCGSETILVDEVVDILKKAYPVKSWNFNSFVVGVDEDEVIWDSVFTSSIDGGDALTIIRGFDKVKDKHLLKEALKVKLKNHVLIVVTGEDKIEKFRTEMPDGKIKHLLPEHLTGFEPKGKLIECIPFTQSTAKTAVAWIKTKVDARDGALVHLLNASNGDLKIVRDVVKKLQWLQEPANVRNVNVFIQDDPTEKFAEALLALEKDKAIDAMHKLKSEDNLQIIGHLDAQVDLAGRVHDMMSKHKKVPEIMKEIGTQAFLVPEVSKYAKNYSRERRMHIRVLLAEADRRLRRGITTGVLETLVVMW